jgi:trimethylamine--corrinoid protein Co-methyltransferase
MGGVYTVEGVRNVIRMAEKIAGSPQALRDKPFISMVACPISPFKLDESYGELAVEAAINKIPVVVPAEPLCGATAPITLAGNLVIQNVDTLAGIIMTQLANPGAPVLYGCISSITDLRDMKYLAGAVEMGLMNAAAAQMAQFYKLPYYATAGMTDSKAIDAQAGYESAITSTLVALAGANFIHDAAGFVEFCMTASYDKLVVDNEIIGMVMRAVEGIEVSERTLALDEIKKVGPGGHFVSSRHTRKYMRTEQFTPQLSNRDTRDQWLDSGAQDAWQRASAYANKVLTSEPENILPEETRVWIRENIPAIQPFIME